MIPRSAAVAALLALLASATVQVACGPRGRGPQAAVLRGGLGTSGPRWFLTGFAAPMNVADGGDVLEVERLLVPLQLPGGLGRLPAPGGDPQLLR